MARRNFKRIDEQMAYEWRQATVDYLKSLIHGILELETALMEPGILKPSYGRRNDFLLIPGKPAWEAHFLKTGLAKLFTIDEKTGKEIILYLWKEGEIIVLHKQFVERLPNEDLYIQLIEDAELVTITNFRMDDIYNEHDVASDLTIMILNLQIARREEQMKILMVTEKGNRYCEFKKVFDKIWYRLGNEDTCAFLGINLSTLKESKKSCVG
jgi:CRP-like cAMP-binding protein